MEDLIVRCEALKDALEAEDIEKACSIVSALHQLIMAKKNPPSRCPRS